MSNPLYYQWLDNIAKRDYAMAFVTILILFLIGAWLALHDWSRVRRGFVYVAVGLYMASMILAAWVWK